MAFSSQASRRIQVALGVAAVASSLGTTIGSANRALAGPTLSNLINLSNSANVTVNNVTGQSFSVEGVLTITGTFTPFAAEGPASLVNTGIVTLSLLTAATTEVLGLNALLGPAAGTFNGANGNVTNGIASGVVTFASLTGISVAGIASAVSTIGASITNTVFGVSNVSATSAFTSQTTTSLTAF